MKTPWASIARIEVGGAHSGTGFLIGPGYVVTALHVVGTPEGRPSGKIKLFFNLDAEYEDGSPVFETLATIVDGLWDHGHDFAVLQCTDPPPRSKPLPHTARCQQYQKFMSPGFALENPKGFTGNGQISSENEPGNTAGPVIGLLFDFGCGILMRGHSGAPVVVDGRVVGLLRTAYLDRQEKTLGGLVQATSIHHVLQCCQEHSPTLLRYRPDITWPAPNPHKAPVVADRKQEFQDFERMITGQSKQRVLLLQGTSGTGKSIVVEEFDRYARSLGIVVAAADLKGAPTTEQIFTSLLVSSGGDVFRRAESEQGARRLFTLAEELETLERPILLVFDNWQQSPDDLRKWMKNVVFPRLDTMPHISVLITGHEVPEPGSASWKEFAVIHQLESIPSTEDWYEYYQRKDPTIPITKDNIESLLLTNEGVPPSVISALLSTFGRKKLALGFMGPAR